MPLPGLRAQECAVAILGRFRHGPAMDVAVDNAKSSRSKPSLLAGIAIHAIGIPVWLNLLRGDQPVLLKILGGLALAGHVVGLIWWIRHYRRAKAPSGVVGP